MVDFSAKGVIAVIGGGPAGSFFVLQLLRRGIAPEQIVIFDRARFPRPKLCGGGITFRGTRLLSSLGFTPKKCWHSRELCFAWAGRRLTVREPGQQWLVDRAYFDDFLLAQCQAAGVRVEQEQMLHSIATDGLGWRLRFRSGGEHCCWWLIAADGALSSVRRLLACPHGRMGRLVEGVFLPMATAQPSPNVLEFNFNAIADGIPGYGWIFPYLKDNGDLAYKIGVMDGLGIVPGQRLRQWTLAYAATNGFKLEGELAGWAEHYFGLNNLGHRPGLLLVGEAYGIDPLLGEGITPALEHATYAAKRLSAALQAKRLTIGNFERDFIYSEAGWNLYFQRFLADRLYADDGQRWLDMLFASKYLAHLGQSGQIAYGQMARKPMKLLMGFVDGCWRRQLLLTEPA